STSQHAPTMRVAPRLLPRWLLLPALGLLLQRLPRDPLRRGPRRALPSGAARARGRMFHPRRVERRAPAALVVARELQIVALMGHASLDGVEPAPGVQPRAEGPPGRSAGLARSDLKNS